MKLLLAKMLTFAATASGIVFGTPTLTVVAADLMVYPTRVVMTDRQRTAQVDIVNNSQVQSTYKITLVRKRMTETGEFQDVTLPEPGERFADEVVRYSPRQVTLMPGAGQTIRIMFKVPAELEPGEYRSHLLFTKALPAITKVPGKEGSDPNVISMHIIANIGVSIPLIARHGELEAKAAIDPASVRVRQLGEKRQVLSFTMSRSGTRSIYGDVVAYRGKEKVAEGNGFAIYTPNTLRRVGVPVPEGVRLSRGETLRLLFTERNEKHPLAETTVLLP